MFSPVPHYQNRCASKEALAELASFRERICAAAGSLRISCENRCLMIFDCCCYLEKLLAGKKADIWKRPDKEPVSEFQNAFQLLIYALGDQGLLFDDFGRLQPACSYDCWEASEHRYKQLAFAMRDRNFAYLELQLLRQHIDEHQHQQRIYGIKKSGSAPISATQPLTVCKLRELLQTAGISVGKKKLDDIYVQLAGDRLLRAAAPLYLFFALTSDNADFTVDDFKIALKSNQRRFPTQQKPQALKTACQDLAVFHAILGAAWWVDSKYVPQERQQFDPFSLLNWLCRTRNLQMQDGDLIELANLCFSCFTEPSKKEDLLRFTQKVNGYDVGKIMQALFIVFDGQTHAAQEREGSKPRGLKNAVKTIYNARLVDQLEGIPYDLEALTDKQADQILQAILQQNGVCTYNFCVEAFWLITGYIPTADYSYKHQSESLYALCDSCLRDIAATTWEACWGKPLPRLYLPYTTVLRTDILKARTVLAQQCNDEFIRSFVEELHKQSIFSGSMREHAIRKYCLHEYEKVKTPKNNFKSFQYAEDLLADELLDECFQQLGIHLYSRVFGLLASLNQYLWPM